ncbi:MAG: carboxypeptidase-like regulatory domain-containing protein, partial [Patescibacteria group bacterium]
TIPDVYKYTVDHQTDNNGVKTIEGVEWGTYTLTPKDVAHDLIGSSPLSPFTINPAAIQNLQLVVAPQIPRSLMVTVKDSATSLPLSGASVNLTNGGSYSETLITGRGFLTQSDWSGGGGQAYFVDTNRYFDSDGNIETNNPFGSISLKNIFGSYVSNGWLESSTFNTGSASNFYNIVWQPQDQPVDAGVDSVRFQIATGNVEVPATWNFLGPDGTAQSYYTTSDSNINPVHNNDKYLRYKIFLQTASSTFTPNIADVSFTFTSQCTPPGQVIFTGLLPGTYTLTISKFGYQNSVVNNITAPSSWQQQEVILSP